jgi:hypothetical protein
MKTNKLIMLALAALFAVSTMAKVKENIVLLSATPTGSEGSKKFTDESQFIIDEKSNTVIYYNSTTSDDWTVEASKLSFKTAKRLKFSLLFGAGSSFNANESTSLGELLTPAGIDRAANGGMGVLGGIGNGIDTNEGYQYGLDLSELPATVTVRISKINITMLNPTETGMAVNRMDKSKNFSFGVKGEKNITVSLPNNGDWLDLSTLNISLKGGEKNADMMTLFSTTGTKTTPKNEKPSFRIKEIEIIITNK